MVEIIILNYLKSALTVPVYMEKPTSDVPETYVFIEKTGSSEYELVVSSTFAVQSYAASLYEAAALNEHVKQAMRDINIAEVSKVALNSDYNYTDITTKNYRYQAVFDVVTHI